MSKLRSSVFLVVMMTGLIVVGLAAGAPFMTP
jgi:hypothetical protein